MPTPRIWPSHVGERNKQYTHDCDQTGKIGIITIADKIRDGVFAEFTQIGCDEQSEQDVASRPSHQVNGAISPDERDDTRHRDK